MTNTPSSTGDERRTTAPFGIGACGTPLKLDRLCLSLIIAAYVVLGLLYDFTVPFFEKPDELKHFAMIQYIQSEHKLPVVQAGVYKAWDQEGTQPPLYHILAAALVSWLDLRDFKEPPRNPHYVDERSFVWRERGNNNLYLHPPGENRSLAPVFLAARLARWLSLLAGVGTIVLTYGLARIVFSEKGVERGAGKAMWGAYSQGGRLARWLPVLAAGLVAFIPQFLHVSSAITNDSLAVTLAAGTLVVLALVIKDGGSRGYAVFLGIGLGLGAITKLSLLYLVPLAGLVLLFDWRQHRSLKRLAGFGTIIGGVMVLLAGWWYGRNWYVYGDVTALNAHLLYRGGPLDPRPTLAQIWQTELVGLELSFWAAFGAGQILLEPWIYAGLRWVKYIVGLGLVVGFWRIIAGHRLQLKGQVRGGAAESRSLLPSAPGQAVAGKDVGFLRLTLCLLQDGQLITLSLLVLWVLIVFVALLRWMQITPASWGRLLYPTLPALGVLAAWGLVQLGLLAGRGARSLRVGLIAQSAIHIPQSAIYYLPSVFIGILFLLSLLGPFRYIEAAYGKRPLVTEASLPAEGIERLDFVYAGDLRLIGYRVERPSVRPGEWLPVTLYWQALRPVQINYSAFVHLLDQQGQAIGQTNSYPDGGNWPTSMLPPGKVLADTHYVPVSSEAKAPLAGQLALGIFDFEDPQRAAKTAVNRSGEIIEPIVGAIPVLPYQWPALDPAHPLAVNFGGQIRLVGYDWPTASKIEPGAAMPLTLYWEPLDRPGQNLNLFIHLIEPATGTQRAGFDGPPDFPTSFWQPGQAIIDSRTLVLPADLPPGAYELHIGWYNLDNFARLPLIEDQTGDTFSLLTFEVQ